MPATSDATGPEPSHRLIFLHGFTQTHHHWHHAASLIAQRLGTDPTLAFVDLPGHGLSTDDRHEIAASGPPLADLAGRGTYIGYSMGGRFALTAALANWDIVERLVLIGATPGLLDLDHCSERLRSDRDLAEDLEQTGVDAFLDDWLSAPLFASLPPERRGLEHRRRNTAAGLAHSLRWCGTGIMGTAVWHHLARIPIPVLVLAGERDTKFTEIGRGMVERLPNGTFASIAEAGHAAHAERPDVVSATIADWLGADGS